MPSRATTEDRLRRGAPGIRAAVGLSALVTAAFFALCLGILHPGYAINDDIKIIAIAAGYPGVQPSPFLIFSNVLLGFLLVALYSLPSAVNWEIALFLVVDAISLCTLLYFIFSSTGSRALRGLGALLLLACAAYYPLRITFTSAAGLACVVGLTAILTGAFRGRESRVIMGLGVGLTFFGSLIRLEMLAIGVPLALTYALMLRKSINGRAASVALMSAAMLVLTGYGVDRLYVRAHADWQAFYAYTKAAQSIQDSHRLENLHTEIRRIGWSKNDQEVFARYFYPDAETFSLEKLQYLAARVPGTSQNLGYVMEAFAQRLLARRAVLALLVCLAALMLTLENRASLSAAWIVPFFAATALGINLVLMGIYKSPDYVLFSTLGNAAMLSLTIPFVLTDTAPDATKAGGWRRSALVAALVVASSAIVMGIWQALNESGENRANESAYVQILSEVARLRRDGSMAKDAIVVSASHGIPWHWANPLWIQFPGFVYLDTGWTTFSPYYQEILRTYELEPLPESITSSNRLYWASKPVFQVFLARYLEEHEGRDVRFQTVYRLPDVNQPEGERGIELYRLVPSSSGVP